MAYELDSINKWKCICGKGYILESNYSNDWFQYNTTYSIDCSECKQKYHIEEISYTKADGEHRTTPYLVPTGKSMKCPSGYGVSYNIYETPFYEQLCMRFRKVDLIHISSILETVTAHSKIKDTTTLSAFKMSRSSLRTVRVSTVRTHVLEAVEKYSSVVNNFDKKQAKLLIEKERASKVKEESICIYNLEVIK